MNSPNFPLIAGAGPVGLAAALFLARDGVQSRIVDAAPDASPHSKALAVNPRTLEILEPSGITDQMLSMGKRIRGAQMHHKDQVVAEITFKGLHHKYPLMLALSQSVTVQLLEASLKRHGIRVERGLELIHCRNRDDGVEAELRTTAGGITETMQCPWMLAADGAHSTARKELGIQFEGSGLDREWHLMDIPLDTALPEDFAHIVFQDGGGFVFLVRVIEGPEMSDRRPPVWRVISSTPDPLARLEPVRPAGPAVWESEFHISHRINSKLSEGNVFFAGDAAHVHSPMGARGMNLGIEDAWVFSELLRENQLSTYGDVRRKTDRRGGRQIELLSRMTLAESPLARMFRSTVLPVMAHTSIFRNRMIATLTGLDHPLMANAPARQEALSASV